MENINHNDNQQHHASGRVVGGLVIATIGFAFLLDNMGFDFPRWIFSFWSLLLVLGIYLGVRRNFKGIGWLILVLIGAYNTIDRMGFDFDLSKYALGFGLVIIGGFLILRPKDRIKVKRKMKARFKDQLNPSGTGEEAFKTADQSGFDNDVIDVVAVFGGNNQTVYSKNFKGGDISAVFGGADIIMTQADFVETASLDVTAVFGGIKLIVPPNWAIKSNVTAIFGSVEDKRSHLTPTGEIQKVLILDGTAMFGGIEIKSF